MRSYGAGYPSLVGKILIPVALAMQGVPSGSAACRDIVASAIERVVQCNIGGNSIVVHNRIGDALHKLSLLRIQENGLGRSREYTCSEVHQCTPEKIIHPDGYFFSTASPTEKEIAQKLVDSLLLYLRK